VSELDKKIKEAQKRQQPQKSEVARGSGATKLVFDLLAGLLVGAVLGYYIDEFFGTQPIFLFIISLVGIITGFYVAYVDYMKDIEQKTKDGSDGKHS
jgi:ATP synthase protein I